MTTEYTVEQTSYFLTDNERAVIVALECSNYGNGECWALDIDEQSSRPSGITGRAMSGVCASLAKKAITISVGTKRNAWIALTEHGRQIAQQLLRDMEEGDAE